MIDKAKDNISKAMAAALSFGFDERIANDYSLDDEDNAISKYAGIDIYQPSLENIDVFVRKFLLNELAFFPRILDVSMEIIPSSFDKLHKDYIKDARGLAKITLHKKVVEIPFMIVDGELLPFDVIQMDGQRIPFTRDNLKKVIFGIDRVANNESLQNVNGFNPYKGLSKPSNPATSPGFLGDVLQIQDQHIRRRGNDIYITAAAKIDECLEKVANINLLTPATLAKLEKEFEKKASEELKSDLEKIAKEIENYDDKEDLKLFQKNKDLQYIDANTLPNGTAISFPEKEGNDLVMTKGIVISDYMDFAGIIPAKHKTVISNDGRIKILNNAEKFLCFKDDSNMAFKIPTRGLRTLEEGEVFLAFDGNKALYPCVVNYISQRRADHHLSSSNFESVDDIEFRTYEVNMIKEDTRLSGLFVDGGHKNILGSDINIKIATLPGAKFLEMPYDDFIAKKSEQTGLDVLNLSSILDRYSVCMVKEKKRTNYNHPTSIDRTNLVFCTDENTKVIVIKGPIQNYIQDKKQIDAFGKVAGYEESFEKFASATDYVNVKCIDRQRGIFDVEISYIDKSKRIFNAMKKKYTRISEADLKQLLGVLGFNGARMSEVIFKAKNEPFANYPLPANANTAALMGAQVTNVSKQNMKNVATRIIQPGKLADVVVSSLAGSLMADIIKNKGGAVQDIAAKVGKFATESKALSSQFEKVAMAKESKQTLNVAKIMSLSGMFQEKTAAVLRGNIYPSITDVAKGIIEAKPFIEKTAYDLMQLKVLQYKNANHVISPNYIQAAIEQMDNMVKVAYAVDAASYHKDDEIEVFEHKVMKLADAFTDEFEKEADVAGEGSKAWVCQACGKPRDEKKEPHCSCGHDHTITKEEYENEKKKIDYTERLKNLNIRRTGKEAESEDEGLDKEAFHFGFKANGFNGKQEQENVIDCAPAKYAEEAELEKEAGALKGSLLGAAIGGGMGLSQGMDAAKADPNSGEESKGLGATSSALKGAVIGAIGGGVLGRGTSKLKGFFGSGAKKGVEEAGEKAVSNATTNTAKETVTKAPKVKEPKFTAGEPIKPTVEPIKNEKIVKQPTVEPVKQTPSSLNTKNGEGPLNLDVLKPKQPNTLEQLSKQPSVFKDTEKSSVIKDHITKDQAKKFSEIWEQRDQAWRADHMKAACEIVELMYKQASEGLNAYEELELLFKQAQMNVPDAKEIKKENNQATADTKIVDAPDKDQSFKQTDATLDALISAEKPNRLENPNIDLNND